MRFPRRTGLLCLTFLLAPLGCNSGSEHYSNRPEATEIDGEDVGGFRFKLSDYRGKVVMLDFWATY